MRVLCHDGRIADGGVDHAGRQIDAGADVVRALLGECERAVEEQMAFVVTSSSSSPGRPGRG